MHFNLTIATKLAIAYGLFLAPIGYLGYQMVADEESSIDFARKETAGRPVYRGGSRACRMPSSGARI